MCAWFLMSMVTIACYTGKLTANSVVTKQPVPFSTLAELVRRTDYRWGLDPGTSLETFVAVSLAYVFQKNRWTIITMPFHDISKGPVLLKKQ